MDYLYKRPSTVCENQIVMKVEPEIKPATIITEEAKPVSHITFMSQEEYLRDIKTMCMLDRSFMETIRGFCDKVVEVNVGTECYTQPKGGLEQSIQPDESASVAGEGSQ